MRDHRKLQFPGCRGKQKAPQCGSHKADAHATERDQERGYEQDDNCACEEVDRKCEQTCFKDVATGICFCDRRKWSLREGEGDALDESLLDEGMERYEYHGDRNGPIVGEVECNVRTSVFAHDAGCMSKHLRGPGHCTGAL